MTDDGIEYVESTTNITEEQFGQLQDAFWQGRFEVLLEEHEGATQTIIFEVPEGHLGLTVGVTPPDGDIHLSVDRWEKEPHHEVEDLWVWVRSIDPETENRGDSDGE